MPPPSPSLCHHHHYHHHLLFDWGVHDVLPPQRTRVVHQNVDAPELLHGGIHASCDRHLVSKVHLQGQQPTTTVQANHCQATIFKGVQSIEIKEIEASIYPRKETIIRPMVEPAVRKEIMAERALIPVPEVHRPLVF